MHRKFTLLTIFAAALIVFSCKKSNNSSNAGTLVGNWQFLYVKANTSATISNSGITYVTKAKYTSQNNAGTAVFTSDSMTLTGLTYSVSTTATTYLYQGSTLIDSSSMPFSQTVPSTSEKVAYKVIGSDSIYFPAGGIVPGGSGGRFSINKDTLNVAINGSQPGPGGVQENVVGSIYFLKQ